VQPWRDGKGDWHDVMYADRVLNQKGEQWTNEELKESFATDDQVAIMQEIAKHGDIQTNAADRKKAQEDKRKQVMMMVL
jgi:ribosome maturation protein Sdo1